MVSLPQVVTFVSNSPSSGALNSSAPPSQLPPAAVIASFEYEV